jgi:hypothetical protein
MHSCSVRTADGRYRYYRVRRPPAVSRLSAGQLGTAVDEALPALPGDAVPDGEGQRPVGTLCQAAQASWVLWAVLAVLGLGALLPRAE